MSAVENPDNGKSATKTTKRGDVASPKPKPKFGQHQRPLRLRIVLVGDEQTGKSCLIKRYCEKRFVTKYLPTIGIDYGATKIYVDKREVRIHIFDTSGNPLFTDVRNEFYKDAHGVLLVFDVGQQSSFESLSRWMDEIFAESSHVGSNFSAAEQHLKPVVLICANKTDLRQNQEKQNVCVDEYEAKLWADLHGFTYCETSAMSGTGVGDMFHTFFSQIVKKQVELDRAGSLPRTPASARRVTPLPSGSSSLNRRSLHATSPPPEKKAENPSAEQQAVMTRLGKGQNAWQQLGLEPGCSQEEVNKAYRKLAILLHPDKTAVKGADTAFKLLGMARKSILNSFS